MINVKDQVYGALCEKLPGANVTDTYPKNWANLPAVEYVEEENKVYEYTDMKEYKSFCRYRVDIWDTKSTSGTALLVDQALSGLGLKRVQCTDVDDPSGMKHKLMRYEAIIDVETQMTYHDE